MKSRDSCRGFTLLEVLVAFTILVMILSALFHVFSGGLYAATVGDQYSRATLIAQSKLAELAAQEQFSEGALNGRQDDVYRWQTNVAPYAAADSPLSDVPGLEPWKVTVEVSWGSPDKERSVSLSSLVLGVRP